MKTQAVPRREVVWAVLTAAALSTGAAAEELVPVRQESVLVAPHAAAPPKIDGKLGDAAWAGAQPLGQFAYKTKAVAYQTVGWICRDAKNLYFAARCFDDNLAGLATEFEGRALWKNDCIELFVVAEKRELFFSHIVVDCRGVTSGGTWVPDEWGEPTRGKALRMKAAAGREKNAWTVELRIPIAAFGFPVTPKSVWAIGFNREKHGGPAEVSSFQGGFNRPKEYPELRFDARSVVVDGVGLRNIGRADTKVNVTLAAGERRKRLELAIPAGKSVPLPWRKTLGGLREGDELVIDVRSADGAAICREKYLLVAPKPKAAPIDPANIPPARFAKSVLDDPKFFAIGVWLQPAGMAEKYKAMGVNVYVGGSDSYPRPRGRAFLDAVAAHGMHVICPFNQKALDEKLHEHPAFVGWMFGDEPDNVDRATGQVKRPPEALLGDLVRIRRADPTHRVYLNLGCGVANERFVGRGATDEQYAAYPAACDILSYDVYPCNSITPNGPDRLHLVAKGVDRLRKWAGPTTPTTPKKPVWCWIEANKIRKGAGRSPTPDEVKTQIWMALVHGASGYGFFCHSWAAKRMKVAGIEPPMQAALAPINAEVRTLAPVLNGPTVESAATAAAAGSRVDVLVKKHAGATYVFAVNMYRKPAKATITVKGLPDGKAEVLFEDRTVPTKAGKITDTFAPYAVHRYKLGR